MLAGAITVEFVALTWLSRHGAPPGGGWFALFTVAFLAYVLTAARLARAESVALVLAVGLAVRVPWLLASPTLSDDVWRYLHDGRAQLAGVNPYRYAPSAPEADRYAGPERGLINHPDLPTIYPPFAQWSFRAAAAGGATLGMWKLIVLAFELVLVWALVRLPRPPPGSRGVVAWYWLHPLPVIEFAGHGHVDAVAICAMVVTLVLASGRPSLAGVVLAVSTATKYLAAPLVWFLGRAMTPKARWRFVAGLVLALVVFYLPYRDPPPVGSLGTFASDFSSNGLAYELVRRAVGDGVARGLALAVVIGVVATQVLRRIEPLSATATYLGALLLASPIVHPWYLAWLVPTLIWAPRLWVLVWTWSVYASYAVLPGWLAIGIWEIPVWAWVIEYLPVYGLLLFALVRHITTRVTAVTVSR